MTWVQDGEQCTKTFLNMHSKSQSETLVHEIRDMQGNLYTDESRILNSFSDFYKNLYSQYYINEIDQDNFLGETDLPTLTQKDFECALHNLANGKSPGSDGFPVEFYKHFWDLLGPDLYHVAHLAYAKGKLPFSQRQATIKCLPKEGDLSNLKNWRPISLLKADYKIIAKAISLRLLKLLPSVISEEQTCSIKGRRISQNLSIVRDFGIARIRNLDASLI